MKYRLSVAIVVQRDQKILCVSNRRFGGFSVPGGKVEDNETFEQAARRELLEETGCEALELKEIAGYSHPCMRQDPSEDPWLCMGFIAEIGDQEPRQMEEGTIPSWRLPAEIIHSGMYGAWYSWFFDIVGISYANHEAPASS